MPHVPLSFESLHASVKRSPAVAQHLLSIQSATSTHVPQAPHTKQGRFISHFTLSSSKSHASNYHLYPPPVAVSEPPQARIFRDPSDAPAGSPIATGFLPVFAGVPRGPTAVTISCPPPAYSPPVHQECKARRKFAVGGGGVHVCTCASDGSMRG